jgi:hypothetical protein
MTTERKEHHLPSLQDTLLAVGATAYFAGFLAAIEGALERLAY